MARPFEMTETIAPAADESTEPPIAFAAEGVPSPGVYDPRLPGHLELLADRAARSPRVDEMASRNVAIEAPTSVEALETGLLGEANSQVEPLPSEMLDGVNRLESSVVEEVDTMERLLQPVVDLAPPVIERATAAVEVGPPRRPDQAAPEPEAPVQASAEPVHETTPTAQPVAVENRIYLVHEVDVAPQLVERTEPGLPRRTREARIDLLVVIDRNGRVASVVVESATQRRYVQPVLQSVYHWRFAPALKAGQPVSVRMRLPVVIPAS